jgi:hypothetical protein
MRLTLGLCCLLGSLTAARASPAPFGYLYQPAYSLDARPRLPAEAYCPQPGDILLPSHQSLLWSIAHQIAGTGRPGHSAVVVALPDGTPAVLEAGSARKGAVVVLTPLRTWLAEYRGKVWCRRRKTPITEDQSARLTEFALLNDKKCYAVLRLVAQLTPFRKRGYYRTTYIGRPHGIRRTYYCSELVLEAMVYAGLLDPETTRPTATYPRDIFFDRSNIPHIDRHLGLACDWHVPAFWTWCPSPPR